MMTVCAGAAAVELLPGDGECVKVYRLEAEIDAGADGVCDLSGAAVTGETGMRFEHYGDSLVRRVAGLQADWLRVSGDTVWSLGADTRRENTRYAHGLPYLLPCLSTEGGDSVRHNVFMTIDRENDIFSRYSSRQGCGFILPGGDTIASTYCVETEVSGSGVTVSHSRWYADGAAWPVVEQVTARAGDQEQSAVTICPPDEQPGPQVASRAMDGRANPGSGSVYDMLARLHNSDPDPTRPGAPAEDPTFSYAMTAEGITISGECADGATARLFDAAGRQWHEGPATQTIATASLPAGVYLLHITTPTTSQTLKLTLR